MRGISQMIEDDRYCIDILTQLGAVAPRSRPSRSRCSRSTCGTASPARSPPATLPPPTRRAASCSRPSSASRRPVDDARSNAPHANRGSGHAALPDRLRDRRGARHGDRDRARLGNARLDRAVDRACVRLRLRADAALGSPRRRPGPTRAVARLRVGHHLDRDVWSSSTTRSSCSSRARSRPAWPTGSSGGAWLRASRSRSSSPCRSTAWLIARGRGHAVVHALH